MFEELRRRIANLRKWAVTDKQIEEQKKKISEIEESIHKIREKIKSDSSRKGLLEYRLSLALVALESEKGKLEEMLERKAIQEE